MIVLQGQSEPSRILLFGLGTVGSEIYSAILRFGNWQSAHIHYPWDASGGLERRAFWEKQSRVVNELSQDQLLDVHFIWAAGKAGMLSQQVEIRYERKLFDEFLNGVSLIAGANKIYRHLHLVSSAGAIFNGHRNATCDYMPSPLGSYGLLKAHQERACSSASVDATSVYRPSSIISHARSGNRRGLVTTLLSNQQLNRPTQIYGRLSTLRDYVDGRDVGRFIARKIVGRRPFEKDTYMLVSGKPTSVRDIIFLVEKATRRPLNLRVCPSDFTNEQDITFSRKAICPDFQARDLEASILDLEKLLVNPSRRIDNQ